MTLRLAASPPTTRQAIGFVLFTVALLASAFYLAGLSMPDTGAEPNCAPALMSSTAGSCRAITGRVR
jgi:hypothetical protein